MSTRPRRSPNTRSRSGPGRQARRLPAAGSRRRVAAPTARLPPAPGSAPGARASPPDRRSGRPRRPDRRSGGDARAPGAAPGAGGSRAVGAATRRRLPAAGSLLACLPGPLLLLVLGERLGRVDIGQRRVGRGDGLPPRRPDAEPLREEPDQRPGLHLPDPRERTQAPVEVRTVACLGPDAACILSLIHISEPTRLGMISYAVFCL